MKISKELLDYVADGDLHIKMDGLQYSTNLRDIVTVGYMIEHQMKIEKAPTELIVDAPV